MRKLMVGSWPLVAGLGLAAQTASAQTARRSKPIQFGVQGDFATNHYGPRRWRSRGLQRPRRRR